MAIYIDMYGNEFVKQGEKYFCPATQRFASPYESLSPYWLENGAYKCWNTRWVPAGRGFCSDEEKQVTEIVSFSTAEQAKQHIVKQLNIRFRTLAILGGY